VDGTHYRVTKTWQVYELPSPTNWVEVSKVLAAINQETQAAGLRAGDDLVEVIASDDKILFRYEIKDEGR
jgi:hypothetical protein